MHFIQATPLPAHPSAPTSPKRQPDGTGSRSPGALRALLRAGCHATMGSDCRWFGANHARSARWIRASLRSTPTPPRRQPRGMIGNSAQGTPISITSYTQISDITQKPLLTTTITDLLAILAVYTPKAGSTLPCPARTGCDQSAWSPLQLSPQGSTETRKSFPQSTKAFSITKWPGSELDPSCIPAASQIAL